MKKNIFSLFSFGLLLIVIGGIGALMNWEQSMIFIGLGLTLESLALVMFAWNKIKKK